MFALTRLDFLSRITASTKTKTPSSKSSGCFWSLRSLVKDSGSEVWVDYIDELVELSPCVRHGRVAERSGWYGGGFSADLSVPFFELLVQTILTA